MSLTMFIILGNAIGCGLNLMVALHTALERRWGLTALCLGLAVVSFAVAYDKLAEALQ